MKVAYFGLPLGALLLLQDGVKVEFAALSPVDAPGRRRLNRRLPPEKILDFSETPTSSRCVGPGRVEQLLTETCPDLLVSWYWTRKIPASWLRACNSGGIGVHPSLLPRHRGPNPFFWAIDCGDLDTGVSVHRLEAEYDTGALLDQARVPVDEMNSWQLARALDRPSLRLLRSTVSALRHGAQLSEELQDTSAATWAPEPTEAQLRVDWHWSTARILRRIRALAPTPGLALEIEGLAFFATEASQARVLPVALTPGEAALLKRRQLAVMVRTSDGAIVIERAVIGENDDNARLGLNEGEVCSSETLAQALLRRSPKMVSSFHYEEDA